MRRIAFLFVLTFCVTLRANEAFVTTVAYDEAIDAVSLGVSTDAIDLAVSGRIDNVWTAWKPLEIEKEFDPLLRESNLVLFPEPVDAIRIRGTTRNYVVHPIRVAKDPIHYQVALRAPSLFRAPRILKRNQWGADESILTKAGTTTRSDQPVALGDNGGADRAEECNQWRRNFPEEFAVDKTSTRDKNGKIYRWAQRYSHDVKLLVVHHTALDVSDDPRPGVERMRALYQYHANNRGWGDVGYHYVVDEDGQVYEGRAGGDYVIGGHAYCNNVGTVGIALMGNFDMEKPTQQQMKSLKWLLGNLAGKYGINLSKDVRFHGQTLPPIVGHKDLISTSCPGYYVKETLAQVQRDVATNRYGDLIVFPTVRKYVNRTADRRRGRIIQNFDTDPILEVVGSTEMKGQPGGDIVFQIRYRAGINGAKRNTRIATVTRSNSRIGLWQDFPGAGAPRIVQDRIVLPKNLGPKEATYIQLRAQIPRVARSYTLGIGDIDYTLRAEGPRARLTSRVLLRQTHKTEAMPDTTIENKKVRIRLGHNPERAWITTSTSPTINTRPLGIREMRIDQEGDQCVAYGNGIRIAEPVLRIDAGEGITTITSWKRSANRFRGVIECRIIDDQIVLINELPIEMYLWGLAEEPDSEPYEKQRAFAVAARSYATFYTHPANRKFAGMPYDGSDSPASFQAYGGVHFEFSNPRWVEAVKSTAGQVIMKEGSIVKTPYFSSDDGRTRSTEERGWTGFPFKEVFVSKPDPWCEGMEMRGHGVGMSGCGAEGQALQGKTGEQILQYYYPGTEIAKQ